MLPAGKPRVTNPSRLRCAQVACDKGVAEGLKMPFPANGGFFCGFLCAANHFLRFFDHG
jgi:hypothetical protein